MTEVRFICDSFKAAPTPTGTEIEATLYDGDYIRFVDSLEIGADDAIQIVEQAGHQVFADDRAGREEAFEWGSYGLSIEEWANELNYAVGYSSVRAEEAAKALDDDIVNALLYSMPLDRLREVLENRKDEE